MSFLEIMFCDSIYHSTLSNEKIKKQLVKIVYDLEENVESNKKTNQGGYQKDLNCKDLFLNLISKEINKYEKLLNFNKKLKLDNLWCNINYKNSYNVSHVHPEVHFSGVYYLETPKNCGKLIFTNPNTFVRMHPEMKQASEHPNFKSHFYIQPVENLLLIFPSYLLHEVEMNNSNEKRISISFNLCIK